MRHVKRPLLQKMIEFKQGGPVSFHVPGHKNGLLSGLPMELRTALAYDTTELTGLDDLHQPEGVIQEAQESLRIFYGADASYFLVNGSTVGNLAMIYGTCRAGDTAIVQRNAHKSIFNALELVGVQPILVTPEWDEGTASVGVVSEQQIQETLHLYPDAKVVVLTYPTYYGAAGDHLTGIIELCHKKNIPVLVDEAHGAHFVLGDPFPQSALSLGADIVVHSAHKTLPAMTMGSYLHIKSKLVSKEKVEKYLQMLQSSSPSYLLMASLDDARAYAESYTALDKAHFAEVRKGFIAQLQRIERLQIVSSNDPLKLMIRVEGYSGFQLQQALEDEGVYGELADPYQVLFVLPLLKEGLSYDDVEVITRIEFAVKSLCKLEENLQPVPPKNMKLEVGTLCYTKDELERFESNWLCYEEAVGKVAAASVIPYPPGIPLLIAGERVREEDVVSLRALTKMNASFQGAIRVKEKQILVVMNEDGE